MFKFFNQYLKISKTLKLLRAIAPREEWKHALRLKLVALSGYTERHNAPRGASARAFRFAPALVIVVFVAGISTGTSFAAKDALPNDSLYGIKLITERFQGVFVFGNERKAEFMLALAERRLDEAGRLAEIQRTRIIADITEEVSSASNATPIVALWQPGEDSPIMVEVIGRFENTLKLAQSHIEKVEGLRKDSFNLVKIAQQLEKLQEKQNKLQEKLRIHVPALAQALENAQVTSLDIQQEVDRVIITLTTTPRTPTTSTTTTILLPENNARARATRAIERAEQKIHIVEDKLERFSGALPNAIIEDDDDEDEDDDQAFMPVLQTKKLSKAPFGIEIAYADDDDEDDDDRGREGRRARVRFVEPREISRLFIEAQKKLAQAKEKLSEAKNEFADGDYREAYEEANDAFRRAVEAEGRINRGIGFGVIITPDATTPVISDILAQTISTTSATITWTTNEVSDSRVSYGTTSSLGVSVSSGSFVKNHSIALQSLQPSTVYHFNVVSKDVAGNVATSSTNTFTTASVTAPPDTTAPVISALNISNVGTSSATITWTTNELATSRVEYGTTTSYGLSVIGSGFATSHSLALGGLAPQTMYHARVISSDAAGNTATSSDVSFTTSGVADTSAPVISAINAIGIGTSSSTVVWTTNELATSRVEYGTSSSYGLSVLNSTPTTGHSLLLQNLSQGTEYHYRVISVDGAHNGATSSDHTFLTATSS